MDKTFLGTELKYSLNINSPGFSMASDEFEAVVEGNGGNITFHKSDFPTDASGNYYLCFNTRDFGAGPISVTITAHVPDAHFPDGFRDEVVKISNLITVLEV